MVRALSVVNGNQKMARDLGEMAQATLKNWAAQVSITANNSTSDREGWDFLLQFPPEPPTPGVPLDLRTTRIECFVQVKGIGTSTRQRKSVELSNWDKLVGSPLPAFFLVVEFGTEEVPQNAYLIHVNEEWIARVLKRLRELPESERESLNKHTLDLTWSLTNRIDSLNGRGLESEIRRHVGSNFDTYVQNKEKLRETVGRTSDAIIQFTSAEFKNVHDMHEEWVDFAIGLRNSISTSKITIDKQVRFGIPTERIEHEGGVISITPSGNPVDLEISNTQKTMQSRFRSTLYTPAPFDPKGIIPKEQFKVRIRSEMGDFVFRPFVNPIEFSGKLELENAANPRKLGELINLWHAIEIFMKAESEGCILEICDGKNPSYRIESTGDKLLENDFLLSIATAVDRAWLLARLFDVSAETEISLGEIHGQDSILKTICDMSDPNIIIASISKPIISGDFDTNKEHAFIFSRILRFGRVILAVFVGFAGYPTIVNAESGEKFLEIKKPIRILFEHKKFDKINETEYRELILSVLEKLRYMGYEVSDIVD